MLVAAAKFAEAFCGVVLHDRVAELDVGFCVFVAGLGREDGGISGFGVMSIGGRQAGWREGEEWGVGAAHVNFCVIGQ